MRMLEDGLIHLSFSLQSQVCAVKGLLEKYRKRPMDFADACLVRMTELAPKAKLLTIDRDFLFYRRNGRQVIPTLMPDR